MITLIIIVCVVLVIFSSKKDKHNVEEDASALAKIPSFTVKAKPMSGFSKFLNLAYDDNQLIQTFSFSNQTVDIRMKGGKKMSANLSNVYVEFQKVNGLVYYKVKGNGVTLDFYQTTNITNKEWDAINGILCLAGETHGRDMFSKTAKRLGYINTALKAIKLIS